MPELNDDTPSPVALRTAFRYKAGIIPVILGCGVAGLAYRLVLG